MVERSGQYPGSPKSQFDSQTPRIEASPIDEQMNYPRNCTEVGRGVEETHTVRTWAQEGTCEPSTKKGREVLWKDLSLFKDGPDLTMGSRSCSVSKGSSSLDC